jgi:hypothetical protein
MVDRKGESQLLVPQWNQFRFEYILQMVSPDPGGVEDEVSTMAKAKSNQKKQAQEKQEAVQRDMAD